MTTSTSLTRRSLLQASPALLAPLVLSTCGTEVLSAPADPLPAFLAAHRRLTEAWLALSDDEEVPEAKALWDERRRLERLIEGTVASTAAGITAQIEYSKREYGNGLTDGTPETNFDLPAAFVDVILAGVQRLA